MADPAPLEAGAGFSWPCTGLNEERSAPGGNGGAFMRKTSIDELPQLFNVVRGDMSLVGPRPPLPSEVAEYTDYDMQRLLVVPGCSGLWQATVRNSVGFHEMVQLDLEYIQKSSIWFDIKILFMTIKILFKPNSAY